MNYIARLNNKRFKIGIERKGGNIYSITLEGKRFKVDFLQIGLPPLYSLIIDGISYEVSIDEKDDIYDVAIGEDSFSIEVLDEKRERLRGLKRPQISDGVQVISTIMPGKVIKIFHREGDKIKRGEPVVVIAAMKMENEMRSPKDGVVISIKVKEGETVEGGGILAVIE
jgi:biotin carboxyl carrier protein